MRAEMEELKQTMREKEAKVKHLLLFYMHLVQCFTKPLSLFILFNLILISHLRYLLS